MTGAPHKGGSATPPRSISQTLLGTSPRTVEVLAKKKDGEFHQLLRNPRFRHADLVVLGDFNLHLASVATANKRYERQVESDI